MKAMLRKLFIVLCSFAAQVGVIGIGVYLGSAAMQWAGFVGLILMACALLFGAAVKLAQTDLEKKQ